MVEIKKIGIGLLLLAFLLISVNKLMESAEPKTGPAGTAPESLQGLSMVVLAIFMLVGIVIGLLVLRLTKR